MAWNGSLVIASPTGNYHHHHQQFSVNEDNGEVFLGGSPKRPFYSAFDAQEEIVEDISGDDLPSTPHAEKKRRLTSKQVSFLERSFEAEIKLEPERKALIAKQLGLQPRQVAVWFQNRRARWKTKQLESDYINLKAGYDAILKENDDLQAEVKRLQAQLQKAKTAGSEESPPPFVPPVLSDESPCSELHPKVEDGELDDSVHKPPCLHTVGGVSEKMKEEEEEAAEELSSSSSPSKSDDSEVLESSAGFTAISVEPPIPLSCPLSPPLPPQPFTPGEEQLFANPYLYNPYLFQHHLVMKLEGGGGGGGGGGCIPSGAGAFFTDESSTSSSHVFFAWEENTPLYPWYNEGCEIFAKPSSKEDDKCSYHI